MKARARTRGKTDRVAAGNLLAGVDAVRRKRRAFSSLAWFAGRGAAYSALFTCIKQRGHRATVTPPLARTLVENWGRRPEARASPAARRRLWPGAIPRLRQNALPCGEGRADTGAFRHGPVFRESGLDQHRADGSRRAPWRRPGKVRAEFRRFDCEGGVQGQRSPCRILYLSSRFGLTEGPGTIAQARKLRFAAARSRPPRKDKCSLGPVFAGANRDEQPYALQRLRPLASGAPDILSFMVDRAAEEWRGRGRRDGKAGKSVPEGLRGRKSRAGIGEARGGFFESTTSPSAASFPILLSWPACPGHHDPCRQEARHRRKSPAPSVFMGDRTSGARDQEGVFRFNRERQHHGTAAPVRPCVLVLTYGLAASGPERPSVAGSSTNRRQGRGTAQA